MAAESFVGRVHVEVVRDLSPVGVNDSMAVAFTHCAVRVNAQCGQQRLITLVTLERDLFENTADPVGKQHARADPSGLLDLLSQVLVANRRVVVPSDPQENWAGGLGPPSLCLDELNWRPVRDAKGPRCRHSPNSVTPNPGKVGSSSTSALTRGSIDRESGGLVVPVTST
jgi:hypothetical protein